MEDLCDVVHFCKLEKRVHVFLPRSAAYLFGECANELGLHFNHVSFGPLQLRCSEIDRVEPKN